MADLNALIAQGYQVQAPPDPFAQYSKMQQLENSATQNRLAQQQMQEHAQMAPLRMQEMQAKLGAAKLTFDEAKQAKDVVDGLMAKSAENGGPTDPIETIKFLISHPNSRVQQMGKTMADSYKLLQEFEQQQKFDQGEPAAAPAAAPTAAYTPQRILVGSQSVQPSALGSGTFDANAPVVTPVAAPAAAAPAAPTDKLGQIEARIAYLNKFPSVPRAKLEREELIKLRAELVKPYVVDKNLVTGTGNVIYSAPEKPGYHVVANSLIDNTGKVIYEGPAGTTIEQVTNPDQTISFVSINKGTNVATPIMQGEKPLTGVSIPFKDLAFRQQEAAFKQAYPTLSIQQITQSDGSAIVVAVNPLNATYQPVVSQGGAFVPAGPTMPLPSGMAATAAPSAAAAPAAATVPNALAGGAVTNALASGQTSAGQPLISAPKPTAPPTDQALMTALGFPLTQAGYTAFKEAQRQDRLLNPAEEQQKIRIALASRPPGGAATPAAPVAVIGPNGKPILVSREQSLGMTPASAQEGLAPKEIQAREAKYPAATSAVKTFEAKTDSLAADLEKLAKHPGLSGISGIIYGRTPAVTQEARAAQALYDSIVARGGFAELQNMRAASPTGGALGNVSNQEGQYLRDAFAPISRTQDTRDLSTALTNAANAARASKQRVREAYDMTYDYKTGNTPAAAPAGGEWKVVK